MNGESVVVRRGERGWQVGDEQAADLTSAMVLADLLAAGRHGGAARARAGRWCRSLAPTTGTGGRRSLQVIIHMLWITMG
jgi:hypothetical protein